jgi:hypothetical protein
MKCDEIQQLHDPYLDSELDARITLEIQRHLAACASCGRLFAEQENLNTAIAAHLKLGQRTAALWDQIERTVAATAPAACDRRPSVPIFSPFRWNELLSALVHRMRASLRPSVCAWAGLAAVWVVILGLNFAARESDGQAVVASKLPSASEMRLAFSQKQLLMSELAAPPEPVQEDKPKKALPGSRSDRRGETLNA